MEVAMVELVNVNKATQGRAVKFSIRVLMLTVGGMGNVLVGAVNVKLSFRVHAARSISNHVARNLVPPTSVSLLIALASLVPTTAAFPLNVDAMVVVAAAPPRIIMIVVTAANLVGIHFAIAHVKDISVIYESWCV
eukprot:SAG11_NODE_7617_length_1120_cov_3.296768_2_plen_136_part_00